MLRTLIVDDEPAAVRSLERLLTSYPGLVVCGTATTASEARRLIETLRPDVLFLDVQLDAATGFELLDGPYRPPDVIFVTAHPGHAVEAFSVEAADFLVKPIDPGRLAQAVQRVERRQATPSQPAPIVLRMPGKSILVTPDEVAAFLAEGDFTRVCLADGTSVLILKTLGQFEASVPPSMFTRLDRSILLNVDRVRRLVVRDRNTALVTVDGLGQDLPLGRAALARLKAALSSRQSCGRKSAAE